MKAMLLTKISPPSSNAGVGGRPLSHSDVPRRSPRPDELLLKVAACGVCRTELDQIAGRIYPPKLQVIPGHQPVGVVVETGTRVTPSR